MAALAGQELAIIQRAGRTWAVVIMAAGILLAGVASGPATLGATSAKAAHMATSAHRHPGITPRPAGNR